MTGVLIGSSNVYKFYRTDVHKSNNTYSMVRCTDINNFKAVMNNLEDDDKHVIISVVENFLSSAARNESSTEGYLQKMGETMDQYLKILKETAARMPATRFAVADPISRPIYEWYQTNFEAIELSFAEGITWMKQNNISRVKAMPHGCQQFEADGVHLTEASAQIFIETMLKESELFFAAKLVDLVEEERMEVQTEPSPMERLEKRLEALENKVTDRLMNDNLIFARLKEDFDWTANKAKEDRVIITGITSRSAPPTNPEERRIWMGKIVQDIFDTLIPGFTGKVIFINQMKNKGSQIPMVEVKLENVKAAHDIRTAFADKKKNKADLGRIFIANSVTLATRVRVDILKAIARKICSLEISAHAVPFISRPVMHVRSTDAAEVWSAPKTYSFIEAVTRFGHLVKQFDLAEAHRRAGNSFKGQLEQHFIVLREARNPRLHPSEVTMDFPAPGGSRKRTREDDGERFEPARGGGPRGGTSARRFGHKKSRK
jgi:hypothetical protein